MVDDDRHPVAAEASGTSDNSTNSAGMDPMEALRLLYGTGKPMAFVSLAAQIAEAADELHELVNMMRAGQKRPACARRAAYCAFVAAVSPASPIDGSAWASGFDGGPVRHGQRQGVPRPERLHKANPSYPPRTRVINCTHLAIAPAAPPTPPSTLDATSPGSIRSAHHHAGSSR